MPGEATKASDREHRSGTAVWYHEKLYVPAEQRVSPAGDNQTRRFQAAAASLAQMCVQTSHAPPDASIDRYTHARQQSNSVEVGARRAVQDLLRALSAYDGQMLEKTTLLDFLQRCELFTVVKVIRFL